jgi:predicted transcriptional regulator
MGMFTDVDTTSGGFAMSRPSLGQQELEVLRYVVDHGPATVGEVAEGFGVPQRLTRSTVVTVMERLRKKGYLTRKQQEGVYQYASPVARDEIMGGLVQQFVEKTLAGSLTPFVTYFARCSQLSDEELAELQRLVSKLEAQGKETIR